MDVNLSRGRCDRCGRDLTQSDSGAVEQHSELHREIDAAVAQFTHEL